MFQTTILLITLLLTIIEHFPYSICYTLTQINSAPTDQFWHNFGFPQQKLSAGATAKARLLAALKFFCSSPKFLFVFSILMKILHFILKMSQNFTYVLQKSIGVQLKTFPKWVIP